MSRRRWICESSSGEIAVLVLGDSCSKSLRFEFALISPTCATKNVIGLARSFLEEAGFYIPGFGLIAMMDADVWLKMADSGLFTAVSSGDPNRQHGEKSHAKS
jgi:hypothetical protein